MAKKKKEQPKIYRTRESLWKIRRYDTLESEGFTEGELVVLVDRRMSSPGVRKLRRERARELKGLTEAERREWAIQNIDARNEETIAADLMRVSPD